MSEKIHLADSREPLAEHATVTAICGAEVPRVKFAFIWDETKIGSLKYAAQLVEQLDRMEVCYRCKKKTHLFQRYIYGIQDGADSEVLEESA